MVGIADFASHHHFKISRDFIRSSKPGSCRGRTIISDRVGSILTEPCSRNSAQAKRFLSVRFGC